MYSLNTGFFFHFHLYLRSQVNFKVYFRKKEWKMWKPTMPHSDGIVSYCCICMGIVSDLESRGLSKLVIINTRGLLKLFFCKKLHWTIYNRHGHICLLHLPPHMVMRSLLMCCSSALYPLSLYFNRSLPSFLTFSFNREK